MTSPLIDLQGVHYAPEGRPVLSGISLRTQARRIGIVGRNGSGKTSLARVMAGLVPLAEGRVRIAGTDVARDRKAALAKVGILFQNPDHQIIFPTVEEEIGFGLRQQGHSKADVAAKVAETLAGFGKTHWASAALHQLSQGQRQLVCLMSVLAMRPALIILDEPLAGLDIPTTRQLQRVLAGLDISLVQITHDPHMVQGYDRVIWLEGGTIAAEGPAAPVLAAFSRRMAELGDGDDLTDLAG
ncbi:MAG: ABC transporter ATP-binding protein [Sulfitobacter sp.]|nr:ABC transporter ATP-binding protein [Sulfitobacter sp.]